MFGLFRKQKRFNTLLTERIDFLQERLSDISLSVFKHENPPLTEGTKVEFWHNHGRMSGVVSSHIYRVQTSPINILGQKLPEQEETIGTRWQNDYTIIVDGFKVYNRIRHVTVIDESKTKQNEGQKKKEKIN